MLFLGSDVFLDTFFHLFVEQFKELYGKGARKFGFLGLSPLGCLPALRAANPRGPQNGCFEEANSLALAHNNALNNVLTNLQLLLKGFKFCNSNFYDWLLDRINNPSKYGMLKTFLIFHLIIFCM